MDKANFISGYATLNEFLPHVCIDGELFLSLRRGQVAEYELC